jgi:protein phosphatase 1 regulatory subunit 14B
MYYSICAQRPISWSTKRFSAPGRPRRRRRPSRGTVQSGACELNWASGPEPAGGRPGGGGAGRGPSAHVAPAAALEDRGPAWGAALAAPAPRPGSGSTGPQVYLTDEGPGVRGGVRLRWLRLGETAREGHKEQRKRLKLEEWILEQLMRLYDCQEEELPEPRIDVDELLDTEQGKRWYPGC